MKENFRSISAEDLMHYVVIDSVARYPGFVNYVLIGRNVRDYCYYQLRRFAGESESDYVSRGRDFLIKLSVKEAEDILKQSFESIPNFLNLPTCSVKNLCMGDVEWDMRNYKYNKNHRQ